MTLYKVSSQLPIGVDMSKSNTKVFESQIPDFIGYCVDEKLELPFSVKPTTEQPEGKEATSENRKRTGAKEGLYPPQYYSGQYPAGWKIPSAADSAYYQSINKKD